MSFRLRILTVLAVGALALGPSLTLPAVSPHRPTLAPVSAPASHAPLGSPVLPLTPLVGMAIKVKDVGSIAAKFKARAMNAQGDYGTGVASAGGDWEAKSLAAEDNYKVSVADAASKGRYGHGVRGSAAKYTKNASTLGPQRYSSGVGAAQDTYAQAMGPVLQTIAGLNLPPRGVKGTNGQRSDIVATALRKMKVGA